MNQKHSMFYHYNFSAALFVIIIFVTSILIGESMLLTDKQLAQLTQQYGQQARERMMSWQRLIQKYRKSPTLVQVDAVNKFFNKLSFIDDQKMWNQQDYWATPVEFLGRGGGDCEDFSIAKYFTLRELNVPQNQLRLTYVKAIRLDQAHMVVSYYPKANNEPLILDNIDKKIKAAHLRTDLIPAYSFNGDSLWESKNLAGYGTEVGKTKNLGIWQQLLKKIRQVRNN